MKSLNTYAIMNMLNKEQMTELFLDLKKELSKDPYDWFMLKVPRDLPHPFTDMDCSIEKPIELPCFEYCLNMDYWYVTFEDNTDDEQDDKSSYISDEFLHGNFKGDDNIPIGIIEYLYSPELLNFFRENNIQLLARQTTSPTREYSALIKTDPRPPLTPVDLTFESKMFLYTTENRDT